MVESMRENIYLDNRTAQDGCPLQFGVTSGDAASAQRHVWKSWVDFDLQIDFMTWHE